MTNTRDRQTRTMTDRGYHIALRLLAKAWEKYGDPNPTPNVRPSRAHTEAYLAVRDYTRNLSHTRTC